MMEIRMVGSADARDLLQRNPEIRRLYVKALMTDPTRFSPGDTLCRIEEGAHQLWLVLDVPALAVPNETIEAQVAAVFLTSIKEFAGTRWLHVPFLAGESMHEWIHLMENLKDFARQQDCDELQVTGRKGWERMLRPYGFDETARVYTCRDLQAPRLEVVHG